MSDSQDAIEDQLDDLATGQLGLIAAWRLQRRIDRDPKLAQEWADVCALHAELRMLSETTPRRLASTRPSTFTIGGFTMKRRTAALAAGSICLFSVTGALAERYLAIPDTQTGITTKGWAIDNWNFRGQFRGNIALYDSNAKFLRTAYMEGTSPSGRVHVSYTLRDREVAAADVNGPGRFDIKDKAGRLYGSVVLSPLSQNDEKKIAATTDEILNNYLDLYRRPERVDPSDSKMGLSYVNSLPGLATGVFSQDYVHGKDIMSSISGASWKVYGKVRVKATYFDKTRTDHWAGDKMWDGTTGKLTRDDSFSVNLPAKTLTQTESSKVELTAGDLAALTPSQQESLKAVCLPRETPESYWAIADPVAGIDRDTGEWKHVLRSGAFTGYGHHVVYDEMGKPLMILDIAPLTPAKATR